MDLCMGSMYLVRRILEDAHVSDLDMRQPLALFQEEEPIDAADHLAGPGLKCHARAGHLHHRFPCLRMEFHQSVVPSLA